MKENNLKVFISYSSLNSDFAELMKMKFEDSGVQVWRDVYEIGAGEEWRNKIDYGLLNSELIILIMSSSSSQSSYVTYEWAFALGNGKRIVPVLLEECEIHPRIKVLQYLDFTGKNRPWEKLIDRVRQLHSSSSSQFTNSKSYLEQVLEGIQSLANANKDESIDSNDLVSATSKMINASNYLKSIENRLDTILWVDDHPNNNIYEREALNSLGFQLELALSTGEALKCLKSTKYGAIISDMGRKEGLDEGYVLLKEIRQKDKETPYIIYSSSNSLAHKVGAQERGAQGSTNQAGELIDLVTTHIRRAVINQ